MPRSLGFLETFPVLAALPTSVGSGRIVTLSTDGRPYFDHSTGWQRLDVQGDMLKSVYDANNDGKIDMAALGTGSPSSGTFLRGDGQHSNAFEGLLNFGPTSGTMGIEHGNILGAASTPYYDWHSSGNSIDYDARIIATGGTATNGQGTLSIYAATLAVNALLTISGYQVWHAGNLTPGAVTPVRTVTANYTVALTDGVIFVDCTAGPVAVALPTVATAIVGTQGQRVQIKKIDSTANAVTITATGGLIDGAASAVIRTPYNAFEFSPVPGTANWGGF